jgi:hypothetical protein
MPSILLRIIGFPSPPCRQEGKAGMQNGWKLFENIQAI